MSTNPRDTFLSVTNHFPSGTGGTHLGGLATNLHALGIADKTIQAILRHSNVGLTMNIYVKSVTDSQVAAMDTLGAPYNDLATDQGEQEKKPAQTRVLH